MFNAPVRGHHLPSLQISSGVRSSFVCVPGPCPAPPPVPMSLLLRLVAAMGWARLLVVAEDAGMVLYTDVSPANTSDSLLRIRNVPIKIYGDPHS